ncbi:hypothetical protein [Halorussus salinisoli]|uniref:hypothetical protein n=1 Tax=Halorussus salinisoli TaxID=2558242 RepID=UPI0010C1B813|nr:hypothetical protein [Halorussus salinisoli]
MYTFTIGQFALIATVPELGTSAIQIGLLEAGLLMLLIEPALTEDQQLRILVLSWLGANLGISLVLVVYEWLGLLWQTGLVLTVSVAVLTYGLHRYEQLELGLLKEVS